MRIKGEKKMPKKIPMRMCTGCSEMKPKKELVRIVKNKEGKVSIDSTGKADGRGAYICRSAECYAKALKAKRFEKAFGVKIPDDVSLAIQKELEENG